MLKRGLMTSRSPCFLVFPVLERLAPEGLVTHFSFQFCHNQEGDGGEKSFKNLPSENTRHCLAANATP